MPESVIHVSAAQKFLDHSQRSSLEQWSDPNVL
jgi:hypothetical protein